jgi:TM2 domain-containing membrane protein YozV
MSDSGNNAEWLATLAKDRNRGTRSWITALMLSVFLGFLGADRFYLGYPALGVLKGLTAGGIFVWWLFDILLILTDNMIDADGNHLRR